MLTDVVRGGVLVEPPLIGKGGVAKNHFCTSEGGCLDLTHGGGRPRVCRAQV